MRESQKAWVRDRLNHGRWRALFSRGCAQLLPLASRAVALAKAGSSSTSSSCLPRRSLDEGGLFLLLPAPSRSPPSSNLRRFRPSPSVLNPPPSAFRPPPSALRLPPSAFRLPDPLPGNSPAL